MIMANTDFILTADEQLELVKLLLDTGAVFVPHLHYTSPKYIKLSSLDAIGELISSDKLTGEWFVIPVEGIENPLELDDYIWQVDGRRKFSPMERTGGPYLSFIGSKTRTERRPPLILSGFVRYFPYFWVGPSQTVDVNDAVKDLYRLAVKFLKRTCVRALQRKRVFWVGRAAAEAISAGTLDAGEYEIVLPSACRESGSERTRDMGRKEKGKGPAIRKSKRGRSYLFCPRPFGAASTRASPARRSRLPSLSTRERRRATSLMFPEPTGNQ
jgi:hypothetical protein